MFSNNNILHIDVNNKDTNYAPIAIVVLENGDEMNPKEELFYETIKMSESMMDVSSIKYNLGNFGEHIKKSDILLKEKNYEIQNNIINFISNLEVNPFKNLISNVEIHNKLYELSPIDLLFINKMTCAKYDLEHIIQELQKLQNIVNKQEKDQVEHQIIYIQKLIQNVINNITSFLNFKLPQPTKSDIIQTDGLFIQICGTFDINNKNYRNYNDYYSRMEKMIPFLKSQIKVLSIIYYAQYNKINYPYEYVIEQNKIIMSQNVFHKISK
jgi:hypothetical protein